MFQIRQKAPRPVEPSKAPRPRAKGRSSWGFVALALLALSLEGCQSGMLGPCCGLRQKVGNGFRNLGSTVFGRRGAPAGGCCDGAGEVMGGEVYTEGTPIMAPGGMSPSSPIIVPSSPAGSEERVPQLDPIDPKKSSSTSGSSSSRIGGIFGRRAANSPLPTDSAGRGLAGGRGRSDVLAQSVQSSVESAPAASAGGSAPVSNDLLDNLPPVASQRESVVTPTPAPASNASSSDATLKPAAFPIELADAGTPGIVRFGSVAPNLSGGSVPDVKGLDWLKEKGYRTLLDLRESSEVDAGFVEQVRQRGFRYVSLPVVSSRLDPKQVEQFQQEVARVDNRPLYFFDSNGSRPGMLWLVKRVGSEGIDSGSAAREAEELGLSDPTLRAAAIALAEKQRSAGPAAAPAPVLSPSLAPKAAASPASAPPAVPVIDAPRPSEPAPAAGQVGTPARSASLGRILGLGR